MTENWEMTKLLVPSFVVLAILLQLCEPVLSDDKEDGKEREKAAKIHALLDHSLGEFRFGIEPGQEASIKAVPVHRWTNDVRDSHSLGLLGISIEKGKPVAAVATYIWSGKLMHELDSLSRKTFYATQGLSVIWEPKECLAFASIPDATGVEPTESGRLRQMKHLASQFSVTMLGWRINQSDREPLRQLPRELFRYKPESDDCVDGALFAFALGTDPEAILALEAITEGGQSRWQYAFIRQTSAGLEAKHKDQVVWKAIPHPSRNDRNSSGQTIESSLIPDFESSSSTK